MPIFRSFLCLDLTWLLRAWALRCWLYWIVPLWWDAGTLEDIKSWKAECSTTDDSPNKPFVASFRPDREKTSLSRHTLRKRFRTACKVLGDQRLNNLTIHHGRHTFISHALAGGRTLAEVRIRASVLHQSICTLLWMMISQAIYSV